MPRGFQLGPIYIYFYGIILMLGALAAAWLASKEAKRRGIDASLVWDGLIWVLIGGIIGARLWHIFTPPPSMVALGFTTEFYLTHPLDLINIRNGGLGIPGAIIGGGIALFMYARRRKLDFVTWLDIVAPAIPLGQAIGRFGNWFNQEVYGAPTTLPWAIRIDPRYRVAGFEAYETFHPLFLYEALWSLGNMALLLWLGRKHADKLIKGDLFLIYLIVYPLGRFLLEFLRLDSAQLGGINANQTFMAIVMLFSAGLLIYRHWRQRRKVENHA